MSFLEEINSLLNGLKIPLETGVFSGKAPDEYVVVTPMADVFELHADNRPLFDMQEARLSLFSKGNYLKRKTQIVRALLNADFTITARLYVGHEDDTGYHHWCADIVKYYETEE